ncbi:MAG TPA: beta-1,6-N-acetylglucosaminyltransferase [Tepidisphaeraceae bacterium]|nr:beta-1,6-N-acetylglucosaminyltransferase [Tepidisphaeraceae bacterium]
MRDLVTTTAKAAVAPPSERATPGEAVAATHVALAKVAYFIASHVNPQQVARLVRACRSSGNPNARVLVHHDYKVSNLDAASIERLGNVDVLPDAAKVEWGRFTQCLMIRRSMQWLLDNRDVDWVVYLSGQDYPIKPLAQIERDLAAAEYDGFLDARPAEQCSWPNGYGRYHYRYFTVPKFPGLHPVRRYLRKRTKAQVASGNLLPRVIVPPLKHGATKIGIRPLRSPFANGFDCYYGSSWWTLNRRAIQSMCRTMDARPDLVAHYRRILWAPNESFFLTLLLNDRSLKLCSTDNKRLISWTHPETGHPDTLTAADWNKIVSSDAHFARKVDDRVDPALPDMLDRHIADDRVRG